MAKDFCDDSTRSRARNYMNVASAAQCPSNCKDAKWRTAYRHQVATGSINGETGNRAIAGICRVQELPARMQRDPHRRQSGGKRRTPILRKPARGLIDGERRHPLSVGDIPVETYRNFPLLCMAISVTPPLSKTTSGPPAPAVSA